MSVATIPVQQATIRQYAKDLKLATVGGQFLSMAEEAVKQKHGHLSYLEALLAAEVEDRYQHGVARRIAEGHDATAQARRKQKPGLVLRVFIVNSIKT